MTDDRMTFGNTYRVCKAHTQKHHIFIEEESVLGLWTSICNGVDVPANRPASMSLHDAERKGGVCLRCVQSGRARGLWTWG